ncbi:MAG: DEAD/DEAH box helicase [Dehalococcoidia bacterium]|nr:DEAD/DEAH box helicase [Dehalococcoidia bacterium]
MTQTPALDLLHPAVRTWFERRFGAPTDAQSAGWPAIEAHRDVLLAAPTGSGKTLAAFLVGIDSLVREAERGAMEPGVRILYVSPLKALSNDIERNLDTPLEEIRATAAEMGYDLAPITTAVRTGDTPQSERQAIVRRPPHVLITTPESLYLMVTSDRAREALRSVRTVIVDEIHALARDRRGTHLSLTLERLDHLVQSAGNARPQRVGLSATQRPIEEIARFLVGTGGAEGDRGCEVLDLGHQRDLDLHVEVPPSDLEAVAPKEQMAEVYNRLAELITEHKTTLVFVNTRRLSERVALHLAERLGEDAVASHHGSLSKERRLRVEQRLKAGDLKVLVATASLELGIDIGSIDLVCQVGSPRGIATFLQRVGRSGHALGLRPHGRLFPTTRDELVECAALVRAVRAGRLDRIHQPVAPLDVLAQQIVAEVSCEDWREDDLFALVRRAAPYAALERAAFDDIVEMLSVGIGEGAGRAAPLVHRDRINGVLRPRRAARLTAIQNGGTIPELGDYRVLAEPDGAVVGTINEDFAMESSIGDIFLLGSTSWRISRVGPNTVHVTDAQGAPPTIPFWLGEAPGRTLELSEEVGRLRRDVADRLDGDHEALRAFLMEEGALDALGAEQIAEYLRATRDGLGVVPSDTDVVFERFFDDSGGMQLVVHAPFGMRINRAWGLALRKRFCVAFDFELQAAANDDAILLSSGPQHSWPLEEAFGWVTPRNVEESVHSSVFYIPMFPTRWRWNTTRALAVPRMRGGKQVPPFIQRMRADDLMAAVFPEQVGCQEHMTEPLSLPDHPLMHQTMRDCLFEAMDVENLRRVLERVEAGEIRYHARDTVEPSPMAHEIVSGKPYTYLDDAPIEERRTRAITLRRGLPESARDLAALDEDAIAAVAEEAWPQPRNAEEVHDVLLGVVAMDEGAVLDWVDWLEELRAAGRAAAIDTGDSRAWFAVEHVESVRLVYEGARLPLLDVPSRAVLKVEHREGARGSMLRGHMEVAGVTTVGELAARTALGATDVEHGLVMLEAQGFVLRGRFSPGAAAPDAAPGASADEWCDRRLLARIHRYTLDRLRKEIDPVAKQDYMRFLLRWQHLDPRAHAEGRGGLRAVIARLAGFEASASVWESDLLRGRMREYHASWLDELCLAGEATWARLTPRRLEVDGRLGSAATRATPVTLAPRHALPGLLAAVRGAPGGWGGGDPPLPQAGAAGEIAALLERRGALFFDEIVSGTRRLVTDVEQGLRELIAGGWVASDGFQGLREIAGGSRSRSRHRRRGSGNYLRGGMFAGGGPPGRWSLVRSPEFDPTRQDEFDDDLAEEVAQVLLARYGVVFRDIAQRESFAMPWRYVMRALRRLEARGLIRGGRFVIGVAGEQYALPEAVTLLREVRREPHDGTRITVSAVDPVNLTGFILPGDRVPSQRGRTVTFVDGLPENPLVGTPAG